MGAAEEATGLSILNPTPAKLPGPDLLHNLINRPTNHDQPAIDFLDEHGRQNVISYGELDALSEHLRGRISQALRSLPAQDAAGQRIIPLMIPQSSALYVAQLAILKAGAAFCPMNLDAPPERIKFILKDVASKLVLTTSKLAQGISAADSGAIILCVDEEPASSAVTGEDGVSNVVQSRDVTADDLAYVMYTSGSTGTPKGVGISHSAVTQSLLAHDRHIPKFFRFLQFAAPTFDVSVFEIFFPLYRGSTLVCCHRAEMLTDLPGVIRKMDVDACELTPSVAGSLLRKRANAPGLKLVLTIGEMLTKPVVSEFGGNSKVPSILWGMYGPTEAAIHCTLQPAFSSDTSPRCIGFTLDTVSAFVAKVSAGDSVSRDLDVIPLGEVGELVVGGHQLASGYLNRPEQTAASFVQTQYGRVYRTGDKARMLPDGTIECLGRVSEGQIKLNGQRIELGEVEHAILQTRGCHSVYVCVISNILVAFAAVETVSGMHVSVKASCKKWLPSFMIPSEFVIKKSLPQLPSGKIDRMRLKEEYSNSHDLDINDQSPAQWQFKDELEENLCAIAQDVLEVPVPPAKRLLSLGVDSLSAIQLAARFREQDLSISPLDILDSESLRDLHTLLLKRRSEQKGLEPSTNGLHTFHSSGGYMRLASHSEFGSKISDVEDINPCSWLQMSMVAETMKDCRMYVNTVDIKLPQNVSSNTVKLWFLKIAQENEILRSGFIHLNDDLIHFSWKSLPESCIRLVNQFSDAVVTDVDTFLECPFQVDIHNSMSIARITIHHALYDGWTMDLLLDDLRARANGEEAPTRPPFISMFKHFVVSSAEENQAKEFWAEHLQGISGSILPNMKTIAVASHDINSSIHSLLLDPQVLRATAIEMGITPQAFFQASLMWLWGAVSGTDDVTVGSVFSGRTLPISGIERVMGPCLSTLPIRAKLTESSTVRDLIQDIHSINRQIMHLSPIPLTEVKKVAGIPNGSKLFDVLFVYQESISSRKRCDDSVLEISHKDHTETKLLLEVEPHGDRYSCRWTYHSDAFSPQQVQMFADHFSHLCAYFADHLDSSSSSVMASFPANSLSTYTSHYRSPETSNSLAALVETQSALTPDAEALRFAHSIDDRSAHTESITYRQLNETSNRIARRLVAAGASTGGIVAIIMEKSPLLYCGILAILKTGCAYLPVLPSTPPKRIRAILEQAQPQFCIVEDLSSWGSTLPCSLVNLHTCQYEEYSASNLNTSQDPSQLAYVIFTSGTTGTPKGVSVTNKNMLSNIEALSHIYPVDGRTNMLQACSQAFDVSVFEIFFAWGNGMCLSAATNDTLFEDLERSIRYLQVTHLSLTVTVASLIDPANVPDVEFLVTSGEPMTDEVLNRWEKVLYQGYGPSETTNICTVRKVYSGDSSQYLGWSFVNTTSFVFSPDSGDILPYGCVGELCFGGDQIAAGYLNMPEVTSAKFFDHSDFGRLYRSGDLGRMLPDGSLIILGRLDSQIKLRGQRIELREIQTLVLDSGAARACACVVLEHAGIRSQQLALFYVPVSEDSATFGLLSPTNQTNKDIRVLFQTLEGALPAYMVPSFIMPITRLPLTSSGKTNTNHLRTLAGDLSLDTLNEYSQSMDLQADNNDWTEAEKQIRRALATTLNIDENIVNRWTSFATLGLDSISAMPLTRKLQQMFKFKIPLSQVLQNPSISRLAQTIHSSTAPESAKLGTVKRHWSNLLPDELIGVVRQRFAATTDLIETILPCTPLQAAMLASTASSVDQSKYRNQMLFRIERSPEELISYWDIMRSRHGILRTCFVTTDDAQYPLVQITLKPDDLSWSHLQASDLEQCALQHLESLPDPVDSLRPPLALAILNIAGHQNYLSFVCHHALYDGVAIGQLLSEIEGLARGETLRTAPSFEPFLQESLRLPNDTDEFWSSHLHGSLPRYLHNIQLLDIETNGTNGTNGTNSATKLKAIEFHLPLSIIHMKLRESGATLLSLCQAAWSEVLAALLQTSDVWFGNVFSGRSVSLDDIDDLVAPCFNTVPMRVKLSDSKSNRDLMKQCQTLNAKLLQYQFTPLRRIRSLISDEDTRLFDTLLLLQPPAQQLDDNFWTLERDTGYMDIPVVCEVTPNGETDKLNILVHIDSDQVSHFLESLLPALFVHALDTCLKHPSSRADLTKKLPSHLQSLMDRISLSQPTDSNAAISHDQTSVECEEPWGQYELIVRRIVAKLAKVHIGKVCRNTSVFRLGLDSINVVQAASLLRHEGLRVSPLDILENPTCAGIASHIQIGNMTTKNLKARYDLDAFQSSVQQQLPSAKLAADPLTVLPCTPLQQGMLSQFIISEGANYYNFVSWRLTSDVHCSHYASMWMILQSRHQMLRTGFLSITHPDTAFAMVSYHPSAIPNPIRTLLGEKAASFDIQNWRRDCIQHALSNLAYPPWQVVLLDHNGSRSMHLGMHHALYDAYSMRIFLDEFHQMLTSAPERSVRRPISSTAIPMAIATILEQSAAKEEDNEAFWKQQATNMVVNSFPTLTPLRVDVGERMRTSRACVTPLQKLRSDAAAVGVTIQAALQATWVRLLSSYQGDSAVTFGIVLSGRSTETLAEVAFPCITTLPVIAHNVDSNRELLQSMMDCSVALRRHEHTPLTRIQRWTGYPDTALFDTILVYQQSDDKADWDETCQVISETATVDYPISLEIEETRSGNLRISLDFHTDMIPPGHADVLLAQFEAVLVNLLQMPDSKMDDLVLNHPELYSILPAEYDELPSESTFLHQLVEVTAKQHPEKLALEYVYDLGVEVKSQRWNYRELDQFGNRIAHLLTENHVKPGGIVAVCFDKCPEAYFTILGIMKAGCAFVALDPGAPVSRHQFILEDSKAAALVVQKYNRPEVASTSPCPLLEIILTDLEPLPTTPLKIKISPEDSCYCLYTSGTTGTPKGCLITHDNAVQAMLAFQVLFADHWDEDSRWLQFASFHFDVSVLEQYWSWSVGIPVVSAPRDLILSDLISTIARLNITHIDLTPSLARLVHPDEVPSLCRGVFITGGEQLRQDILDVWGSKGVIYNAYGPTEATIGVTMYCRVPQTGRSSNIGKQFPNVGSFVLRPGTDIPVLKGGIGELCVSGRLVGKGYLNRPELTNERFPVLHNFGERVYRTGDLVRVLHDGCFDFLGRADDQVKLRGQRLEIGEVNHAIKAGVASITDVATLVTKHRDQDRDVMVSFIVAQSNADREQELSVLLNQPSFKLGLEAQEACRAKLPGYMVPTYVLCVPYIPLSANNKAQISILKDLFNRINPEELRGLSTGTINGSTQLIVLDPSLARIVARVTRTKAEDLHSSTTIFELGVDSISVIELARQLRASGFAGATPGIILKNPRLSALAKFLEDNTTISETSQVLRVKQVISACYHRHLGAACRAFNVKQDDIEYIVPCTSLQEGMLIRSTTLEGRSAYFNSFHLDLAPGASADRLKASWQQVVDRHAVLRTGFLQTTDGFVQVAMKHLTLSWQETVVEEEDIKDYQAGKVRNWVKSNEQILANPLEVDYVNLGHRYMLTIRIFHGIYDARSFDLLLQHVTSFYNGNVLSPQPSFIDAMSHGPLSDFSQSEPFWKGLFSGFRLQPFPALGNGTADDDSIVTRTFDLRALESKRIEFAVTQQTLVQAAWTAVMAQRLQSWPSMGIVVSGRSLLLDNVENTVGPLFNTLPFWIGNTPIEDWYALVQATHRFNASVLSFAHVPLRQVQKWCSGGHPLFDNLFTFDREEGPVPGTQTSIYTRVSSASIADYPLAFEGIMTKDNQLKVTLVTLPHIADAEALSALLKDFQQVLNDITSDTNFPQIRGVGFWPGQNGDTPDVPNGANTHDPSRDDTSFQWDGEARKIQKEIASLTGTSGEEIEQDTTLFELGLDSIDAVKLVTRLRRVGISLLTSQLMKQPTIRGIIASSAPSSPVNRDQVSSEQFLEAAQDELKNHLKTTGFDLSNVEAVLPPTPLQDAMVAEMLASDFQHYFNHDVLELYPETDLRTLQSAVEVVVRNSPILRTTFLELDKPQSPSAFMQIIKTDLNPFREAIALRDEEELDQVMEGARRMAAASHGQSNLLQLRPLTVRGRKYLVLSIAHALYDGTSLGLLHQDIKAAYIGAYNARQSYKPALARILANPPGDAEDFWSDFLHDAHPTLVVENELQYNSSPSVVHKLEAPSTVSIFHIKQFCASQGITIQALGQACWAVVLGTLARSLSVTFGVVVSGRGTEEEQKLMFPTMNTVAVSTVLHGNAIEYLRYVWDNLTNINEFQHFSLRKAQKLAGSRGPLFNTLFTMQSTPEAPYRGSAPLWKSVRSASEVEYPLCVEMEVVDEQMVWRIACDNQYLSYDSSQAVLGHLDQVMQWFLNNPQSQIIDYSSSSLSVCGLPSFRLRDETDSAAAESPVNAPTPADTIWSENESCIMDVLAEVAGIDRSAISPSQSIYHLGLDSISAIKASTLLRKRGVVVSVREMVKAASIRDIMSRANDLRPCQELISHSANETVNILEQFDINNLISQAGLDPDNVEAVMPALPMQVHMLSVWAKTGGELYFYEFSYDISGNVTQGNMVAAWYTLVAEIPILRTHFSATGSSSLPFAQIIAKADTAPPLDSNEGHGDVWKVELRGSPFVSLQVTKAAGETVKLVLKIHHALYDGVSLPLIIDRFRVLCGSQAPSMRPFSQSWSNFVLAQHEIGVKRKRQDFWQTYLQGAPANDHGKVVPISEQHNRTAEFHPSAVKDLANVKTSAGRAGVSLQALFFAAYAKCLSHDAEGTQVQTTHDTVFGIYLANRTSSVESLEEIPCPTLSIIPLRARFEQDEPLVEVARRIQGDIADISSFENASVGLWEIAEWTGVKIDSFVNFLSLPEHAVSETGGEGVQFTETTPAIHPEYQTSTRLSDSLAKPFDNRVKDAYVDSIDVEAAVRGNSMGIGVFGSASLVSRTRASDLIHRIVALLQDV